ncbi:MAG: 50S ribosomal protein L23, partial [Candidatus Moranbacteria bacterium]|nr:50S ribosomal protein L23 [Candidatus Moranbacteria bacterium]
MAVVEEKKSNSSKKVSDSKKTVKKVVVQNTENSDIAYRALVEPWITEKSHALIAQNKYTFRVTSDTTKAEVKKAIEGFYAVSVEKISIMNFVPKKRAYGRFEGTKTAIRKAIVTLKKGDKGDLTELSVDKNMYQIPPRLPFLKG